MANTFYDPPTCTCLPLREHTAGTELHDNMEEPGDKLLRVDLWTEFTLREWSVNGQFEWNLPHETTLGCVEILDKYECPAYRQISLKTIKQGDVNFTGCRWEFVRTHMSHDAL